MPSFGKGSRRKLSTCDDQLQRLFKEVVKGFDCSVLCGNRSELDQTEAFESGRSKVQFPDSKHNKLPSEGIDVVPYPVDWENLDRFYFFAGYVKKTAEIMEIKVRWGGDWDGDTMTDDQSFMDLPHWELI